MRTIGSPQTWKALIPHIKTLSAREKVKMRHCVLLTVLTCELEGIVSVFRFGDTDTSTSLTHISILPRPEILLSPLNTAQTPTQLVNALLQTTRLFRQRGRFRRCDRSRLTLDHDIEIDQFLRERRHVVGETERVFSSVVSGKDVISLSFSFSVDNDRVGWICHDPINVE